eukprot:10504710-Alexandrium_andersonii.AAC.1
MDSVQLQFSRSSRLAAACQPGKRGMAHLFVAGAAWTPTRREQAKVSDEVLCKRCDCAEEDLFHRLWRCPSNLGSYAYQRAVAAVSPATEAGLRVPLGFL